MRRDDGDFNAMTQYSRRDVLRLSATATRIFSGRTTGAKLGPWRRRRRDDCAPCLAVRKGLWMLGYWSHLGRHELYELENDSGERELTYWRNIR